MNLNLMRPQPVHQLMRQDVGKERLEADIDHRRLGQRPPRDGQEHASELRLLHILQHDSLAALLLDHAVVVGQIVGRGLHAVSAIPRTDDLVHNSNRRSRTQLGVPVLRIDGQIVFDLLQMLGENRELGRLLIIAQVYVRFESRLVAEQFVIVSFVRTNRDIQRRIEVHPRHVAFVIVVGKKSVRSQVQEFLERRVVGQPRRFSKQVRRPGEVISILLAIGNGEETVGRHTILSPADYSKEALGLFLLLWRQLRHPSLESILGHALGIEIRSQRLARRHSRQKSSVIVKVGPRRLVEPEIVEARLAQRRSVFLQTGIERQVSVPHLLHEDVV